MTPTQLTEAVKEPIHIISLGAGVQSSTMALMAACGEITPMPVAAIFADTQAEPKSVYTWLDWLEKQLLFPVHRVTKGNLGQAELRVRRSGKTGKLYLDNNIPAFVKKENGSIGLLGRKCTSDYKIVPLQRKVRELTGVKKSGAGIVFCKMWIGITTDEAHRMKPSRVDYIENVWPLIDLRMSRSSCLDWMKNRGFPAPPRSACTFCPFHNDDEWIRLREEEPSEFASVVKFEADLQTAAASQEVLRGVPFLHSGCKPIGETMFSPSVKDMQISLFGNECEGMCGV